MGKIDRINRIDNSLFSEDELERRLPEIWAIENDEARDAVIRTYLDGCPDYFWERGSSSSGKYHAADEHGEWGNVIHTKRVFAAYVNISQSKLHAGLISDRDREYGKAAALIHDMMKYGWPSDNNYHTVKNHDILAANVAKKIGEVPNEVYLMVHAHMGPWGEGMTPSTDNQWLLHEADKSASGVKEDMRAVYFPCEEILEASPDIPVIDVEPGQSI